MGIETPSLPLKREMYAKNQSANTYTACVRFPPEIHSLGLWEQDNVLTYSLPTLELQIVLIFSLTQFLHLPLQRLGVPRLLSEIMSGVILGSTFLGRYTRYQEGIFPLVSQGIIGTLSSFGFMLFMFISGVRMDVSMIRKTGTKTWVFGLLNLVIPLAAGLITTYLLVGSLGKDGDPETIKNLPMIAVIHSVTCFPVIAQLLKDVKILNSELGRLAMSSSLISHLCGVFVSSIHYMFLIALNHNVERALTDFIMCLFYVSFAIFIIRPFMSWVAKQTPEGRPAKDIHIYLIILGAFISSVFSNYFELSLIFGPFIFGLAVPEGPPIGSALIDKLDSFSSGILLPLFVSTSTLRTNLRAVSMFNPDMVNNTVLVVVIFFTKVFACLLPALYCRFPIKDAFALSLIMSAKGVVDLAKYSFLRDGKALNQNTFAMVIIATALNAFFVPLLVKWLYDPSRKYAGYQKRNIMHTKQHGKLPIFVCIHRSDDIAAITKLLDTSSPSIENPVAVYALHLIELRGRATPIFISHKHQTKTIANLSYSENVILAFNQFEQNHRGITVQTFTAISPRQLMHEDICTLALDSLASIIIIPFHRQWAVDGSVESEDLGLRMLNQSVLERAPCSIGILVDRGHIQHSNPTGLNEGMATMYHVAVIFIGGCDDQEALVYAMRMMKNPSISLTVVHLISTCSKAGIPHDKDTIIDSEVVNNMKVLSADNLNVRYEEKSVNGGHDTSLITREMVHEYDFIIVGRRHGAQSPQTEGLEVWSEFPELGVVGDLLASSDLKGRASVLVIQQQQMNC